jgi:CheY-like chemotaxis protein
VAHILVVEDDADVLEYARALLTAQGHSVEVAKDGEAALVAYMTRRPELILLDVFVPRIDGLRFARQIQEQFPADRVPIVVWTGAYEPESIGDLLETPHVLRKPAAADELLEVVRRALGHETRPRAPRVLVVAGAAGRLRGLVSDLRAEYDVHTAAGWEEALMLLDVRPYEAVVVDMCAEGGVSVRDGVGVLRAVHARYKQMARVALVDAVQAKVGQELVTAGAAEVVLSPPFAEGALAERLRTVVR